MKHLHFIIATATVLISIGACVAETMPPEGESQESATPIAPAKGLPPELDENAVDPPAPNPLDLLDPPHTSSLGINPVGGSCAAAIGAYCPKIYGWNGKCYCQCDANIGHGPGDVHPNCAGMPTAKMCGTVFDTYSLDGGVSTYTFPGGWPTACHLPTSNLAPTVP